MSWILTERLVFLSRIYEYHLNTMDFETMVVGNVRFLDYITVFSEDSNMNRGKSLQFLRQQAYLVRNFYPVIQLATLC